MKTNVNEVAKLANALLGLYRRMNTETIRFLHLKKTGLSLSLFATLLRLYDDSTVPIMTDLSKWLFVSTAAGTGAMDRLEKKGYAKRGFSSKDRRKTTITLTKKGQLLIEDYYQMLNKWIQSFNDELLDEIIEPMATFNSKTRRQTVA